MSDKVGNIYLSILTLALATVSYRSYWWKCSSSRSSSGRYVAEEVAVIGLVNFIGSTPSSVSPLF